LYRSSEVDRVCKNHYDPKYFWKPGLGSVIPQSITGAFTGLSAYLLGCGFDFR